MGQVSKNPQKRSPRKAGEIEAYSMESNVRRAKIEVEEKENSNKLEEGAGRKGPEEDRSW